MAATCPGSWDGRCAIYVGSGRTYSASRPTPVVDGYEDYGGSGTGDDDDVGGGAIEIVGDDEDSFGLNLNPIKSILKAAPTSSSAKRMRWIWEAGASCYCCCTVIHGS